MFQRNAYSATINVESFGHSRIYRQVSKVCIVVNEESHIFFGKLLRAHLILLNSVSSRMMVVP